MALKQQLHQRQVQKLILAPALQQAIKLLPLTNLELIEIIDTELTQNPMLEVQEETTPSKDDENSGNKESSATEDADSRDEKEMEEDKDIEAYFQEYFDEGFRTYNLERKEAPIWENFVSKSTSLWDHLDWQANLAFNGDRDKAIAEYIIGNVDEDGYLSSPLEDIQDKMACTLEEVEAVRGKIMRFDPVGVASLNLREALLTQMDYYEIEDKTARLIIESYLPLLEKSDFSQLARELGIAPGKIRAHIDLIKGLDPTPGRKYSREKTFYVVPDIIVTVEGGEYKISLNDEGVPRLKINSFYKQVLKRSSEADGEAVRFLKDRMKKAFWFLRSLDQRNNTIYKVAKFIVDKQKDFIEKGLDYIKPLTLIELAQEIGVHESTVGRVVANKYIMTPRGVLPLKYFFHKSLAGDYGEEISSLRVKERIRKMVENEGRERPLSDIEIGDTLAKENFYIARRTVAKYRKQLSIPPSHIRKRKYWMEETQ